MKVLFPYEVVYEMIRINSMYSVGLGSVPSLLTDHLELQHNANFEQQIVQYKWLFLALIHWLVSYLQDTSIQSNKT